MERRPRRRRGPYGKAPRGQAVLVPSPPRLEPWDPEERPGQYFCWTCACWQTIKTGETLEEAFTRHIAEIEE